MNELGSNNTYFFYSSYTKKLCIEQLEGSGLKKRMVFSCKTTLRCPTYILLVHSNQILYNVICSIITCLGRIHQPP